MRSAVRCLLLLFGSPILHAMQSHLACPAAADKLNVLKERMQPNLTVEQLRQLYESLKRLRQTCNTNGDLHYYTGLAAERLGDYAEAKNRLEDAREHRSIGLAENRNPFALKILAENSGGPLPRLHRKFALVVGINNFLYLKPSERLEHAVADARSFQRYLIDQDGGGFDQKNVQLLTDGQATREAIVRGIGWLREQASMPGDLVVVYMASHGSPREADVQGLSYIVTHDTKMNSGADLYASSIQMVDLVHDLARDIRARRLVLILDTCFSGDAAGRRRLMPPVVAAGAAKYSSALAGLRSSAGRVVLTASQAHEESWESESLKQGYFTYFLVRELRANRHQPIGKVFPHVISRTKELVQLEKMASQVPLLDSTEGGEGIILDEPEQTGEETLAGN